MNLWTNVWSMYVWMYVEWHSFTVWWELWCKFWKVFWGIEGNEQKMDSAGDALVRRACAASSLTCLASAVVRLYQSTSSTWDARHQLGLSAPLLTRLFLTFCTHHTPYTAATMDALCRPLLSTLFFTLLLFAKLNYTLAKLTLTLSTSFSQYSPSITSTKCSTKCWNNLFIIYFLFTIEIKTPPLTSTKFCNNRRCHCPGDKRRKRGFSRPMAGWHCTYLIPVQCA